MCPREFSRDRTRSSSTSATIPPETNTWPCTSSSQPEQKPPKPGPDVARLAEGLPRKTCSGAFCQRAAVQPPLPYEIAHTFRHRTPDLPPTELVVAWLTDSGKYLPTIHTVITVINGLDRARRLAGVYDAVVEE